MKGKTLGHQFLVKQLKIDKPHIYSNLEYLFKSLIKPRIFMLLLPILFYVCTNGRGGDSDYYEYINDSDERHGVTSAMNLRWLWIVLSIPLLFLWVFIFSKFKKMEEESGILYRLFSTVTIILAIVMVFMY
jgi:hypothetical protein